MGGYDEDENQLLATQRRVESNLEMRIRQLLIGYGDFQLAVRAEINPSLGSEKVEVKYDPEAVTTESSSRSREFDSTRQPQGGVPGAAPNTATASNTAVKIDNAATRITSTDETEESRSEVGQTHEQSRYAGLQTERVTVSIGLPLSYYETAWRREYLVENPQATVEEIPAISGDELDQLKKQTALKIQNAVTPILPPVEVGASTLPLVEVWDYPDLPTAPLATSHATAEAFSWLADSWQPIGLVILAVIALFVARSVVKTMPARRRLRLKKGLDWRFPCRRNRTRPPDRSKNVRRSRWRSPGRP
jgi:flagellar M-ring protein FliF